jgi:hypothetical protein
MKIPLSKRNKTLTSDRSDDEDEEVAVDEDMHE